MSTNSAINEDNVRDFYFYMGIGIDNPEKALEYLKIADKFGRPEAAKIALERINAKMSDFLILKYFDFAKNALFYDKNLINEFGDALVTVRKKLKKTPPIKFTDITVYIRKKIEDADAMRSTGQRNMFIGMLSPLEEIAFFEKKDGISANVNGKLMKTELSKEEIGELYFNMGLCYMYPSNYDLFLAHYFFLRAEALGVAEASVWIKDNPIKVPKDFYTLLDEPVPFYFPDETKKNFTDVPDSGRRSSDKGKPKRDFNVQINENQNKNKDTKKASERATTIVNEDVELDYDLINPSLDLHNFEKALQERSADNFQLLFYGEPGTGKSYYLRYLAKKLGFNVIEAKGSDIIGRYVGDTELNISRLFNDGRNNQAFIIIDEIDGLISRKNDRKKLPNNNGK